MPDNYEEENQRKLLNEMARTMPSRIGDHDRRDLLALSEKRDAATTRYALQQLRQEEQQAAQSTSAMPRSDEQRIRPIFQTEYLGYVACHLEAGVNAIYRSPNGIDWIKQTWPKDKVPEIYFPSARSIFSTYHQAIGYQFFLPEIDQFIIGVPHHVYKAPNRAKVWTLYETRELHLSGSTMLSESTQFVQNQYCGVAPKNSAVKIIIKSNAEQDGLFSKIYLSKNGIDWTLKQKVPTNNSICYYFSGGIYLIFYAAGPAPDKYIYSTNDMDSFSTFSLPVGNTLPAIADLNQKSGYFLGVTGLASAQFGCVSLDFGKTCLSTDFVTKLQYTTPNCNHPSRWFVGTNNAIYKTSDDPGATWSVSKSFPTGGGGPINQFYITKSNKILACARRVAGDVAAVWKSYDLGETWILVCDMSPITASLSYQARVVSTDGKNIIAHNDNSSKVYISKDEGETWKMYDTGIVLGRIQPIYVPS